MKKYIFIVFFALTLFFTPKVLAQSFNGVATVGRSAVMDTSSNYYYTNWTSLNSNSLNVVPVPTSIGTYYHMGAEYVYALTLTGNETVIKGTVKVPVVSNTIYTYQMMNGLNDTDFKLGVHANFGQYNLSPIVQDMRWECDTYPHLGVAHNYCFYLITFYQELVTPFSAGSYNLNFAVFNTNGNHSSYYYTGTDSNGCAIEFPVSASNSGYPTLAPTVSIQTLSGSSGGSSNQDIIDANYQNTQEILDQMQLNYENLVKSQEVCSNYNLNFDNTPKYSGYLNGSGVPTFSSDWYYSDYLIVNKDTNYSLFSSYSSSATYCLYDNSKTQLSCTRLSVSFPITIIPSFDGYIRFSFKDTSTFKFSGSYCQNGNQAIVDSLTNPSVDSSIGADFLNGIDWYENSQFSSIITSPIQFLNSLNDTCQPVVLTLFGQNVSLPCGTTIFWDVNNNYISTFRAFWNTLFAGLIIYRLALQLVMTVNDCLDPTKDKVGGLDI